MKTKFITTLSVVLLLIISSSCNNEEEIMTVGTYSDAEKAEFRELAEQYGAEVYFDDAKPDKKVSIQEFERMLKALRDLKAEFPISYSLSYETPTKVSVPKSRTYSSNENHPVASFTANFGAGENVTFFGNVNVSFTSTGNGETINVGGRFTFRIYEINSSHGYKYSITADGVEKIEPKELKKGDNKDHITFTRYNVMFRVDMSQGLWTNKEKTFSVSVPTNMDEIPVYCSVY